MRAARTLVTIGIFSLALIAFSSPSSAGGTTHVVNLATDQPDDDPGDGLCDVIPGIPLQCTLRAALEEANAIPAADVIEFAIGGGGVQTIQPGSALPPIVAPLAIDGASQDGCASPCIVINGASAGPSPAGITVDASDVRIRGLVIQDFTTGIRVNSNDNVIAGNYVGTNAAGTATAGVLIGITIDEGANNLIGGDEPGEGNVIAGYAGHGIGIIGESSSGNVVSGNYIGVLADGETAAGGDYGVIIVDLPASRSRGIAGSGSGEDNVIGPGNVISGNSEAGLLLYSSGAHVRGNYIGTDAAGETGVPNLVGVRINGADNVVGGLTPADRNIISGNTGEGVLIQPFDFAVPIGNDIIGNYIGTNVDGDAALPNGGAGVFDSESTGTVVGGLQAGAGNLISGNGTNGVLTELSDGASIQGNLIGTDASGQSPIPNSDRAVYIESVTDALVGGEDAGNVVSGNGFDGLFVARSSGVTISNNYVGVAADGETPLGNARDGIQVNVGNTGVVVEDNLTGANAEAGISHGFTDGTIILGNYVGVNPDGVALGNGAHGIYIAGSSDLTIGDTKGGANTIAHNGADGVNIDGDQSNARVFGAGGPMQVPALRNTIRGNSIHTNVGVGINNVDTGNTELAPPVLASEPFMISGTACSGCIIDVYSDDADEGRVYEGTTVADGGGNFQFAGAMAGPFTTATATDADGNTSEFSAPVETPDAPTPSPTPEPTATPTPMPTATEGPTATPGPTATAVPSATPAASETPAPKAVQGDTDCDQDADTVDGLFVLRDVAGFDPSECIENGDVDCDGDRDSVDALGILRHVAALPPLVQQEPCADIGTPV